MVKKKKKKEEAVFCKISIPLKQRRAFDIPNGSFRHDRNFSGSFYGLVSFGVTTLGGTWESLVEVLRGLREMLRIRPISAAFQDKLPAGCTISPAQNFLLFSSTAVTSDSTWHVHSVLDAETEQLSSISGLLWVTGSSRLILSPCMASLTWALLVWDAKGCSMPLVNSELANGKLSRRMQALSNHPFAEFLDSYLIYCPQFTRFLEICSR